MGKQRVWLVSEVFYPDTDIATANIATDIALKFRENFEVHVICGPQDYERKNQEIKSEALKDIHLHRWKYFNYDKNHKFKRLIRVIGISLGLFLKGLKIKKHDKVFVISNPAFITPLYALLRLIKGFRFTLLMHDVFPENLIVGGYTRETNIFYRLTKALFVKCRRAAEKIIVLGRDMKTLLLEHFPISRKDDIIIVPNWADIESVYPLEDKQTPLLKQLQLQDKVVILFAGNHGVLQNLLAFIKIIEKARNPHVHCIFAGGGATKKELEAYVEAHQIPNITFLPPFPRSEMNQMLNSCHIGLVSLSDAVYGVGVPSKSYNILSAGKPILFLGNTDSEIAQYVIENNLGWAFAYRDEEQIRDFLLSLDTSKLEEIRNKGLAGRNNVVQCYSKEAILERLMQVML
ncbi:hypothetical protein PIECOFPK_01665 [Mycovorax composti]|uniref:Glycosyltransferase n=1 Tax=Mycovorax composti TaxID=2962693 RepID=A0ABZ2EK68_9BACT